MGTQSTILIVDDQPVGREVLDELLFSPQYTLVFAASGAEGLEKAFEVRPDLILLDVMMPDMDGFEVCRRLRADSRLAEVPILMLTALEDDTSRIEGIEAGADDFITKPFNRAELRARVATITRLARYRKLLEERANLEQAHAKLLEAYDATIAGWSRAMELRDTDTEGHTLRVTELTVQIARKMGLSGEEIVHIRRGALLHDMGKLAIPDRILHKPSALSDEEWEVMKKHPQYACDMLSAIEYLRPALDIPLYHHERWNGKGYPRGLAGEAIPLAARIFAVADVWDALTSHRPYRAALPAHEALRFIVDRSGVDFDPQVVEVFVPLVTQADPRPEGG